MLKTISMTLAGAALLATPALAAQEREQRTTGVSYQDLDLTSEDGRKELDSRIEGAAKEVCGMGERSTGSNMASRESRKCYRDAKRQLEEHFADVIEDLRRGG